MTRPALVIVVEYEGCPSVRMLAESFEQEQALRLWLRSAGVVRELDSAVLELLNQLDQRDEWPDAA